MNCIIHVGLHHTGTTSLQHFFALNSPFKNLILYPKTGIHGKQHGLLPGCFIENHPFLPSDKIKNLDYYFNQLKEEVKQSNVELCVISSEVFTELLGKKPEKIRLIFNEFEKIFNNLEILITNREDFSRSLSQFKAKVRLSYKKKHFRNEIFEAPTLFKNKLKSSKITIKKWSQFNRKVNVINYQKDNLVKTYFDFITSKLSFSSHDKIKEYISNKPKLFNNYNYGADNLPQYLYLILIIVGLEIFKKDKELEDKLTFNMVKSYSEKLSIREKEVLSEINSFDLINFLIIYGEKNLEHSDSYSITLSELTNIFKFRYEVAYFIIKSKEEIIDNLIFDV